MSKTENAAPLSAQTIAELELGRQRVAEAQRRINEAKAQSAKPSEPEDDIEVVEMKPKRSRGVKLERVEVPPPVAVEPEPAPATETSAGADELDELLNA